MLLLARPKAADAAGRGYDIKRGGEVLGRGDRPASQPTRRTSSSFRDKTHRFTLPFTGHVSLSSATLTPGVDRVGSRRWYAMNYQMLKTGTTENSQLSMLSCENSQGKQGLLLIL